MRTADFFIEKANSYLITVEKIESNYKNDSLGPNSEYHIQQKEISEIKLKIKLMFAEFEHGNLFSKRIDEIEGTYFRLLGEKSNLLDYGSLLNLFIDHVKEYRSETLAWEI